MNTTTKRTTDRDDAIAWLRELVKPGDIVYTVLRHVSRSGMSRSVGVILMQDGEPGDWSSSAARAIGQPFDRDRGGIKVGGCGTDAGLSVVMALGYALWPDGFGCIGDRCPSNDHVNGDRDYTPHCFGGTREHCAEGHEHVHHWHRSGGYALRHRRI